MAGNLPSWKQNKIRYIILAGFCIRVLFYLFGARIYYGTPAFIIGRDSGTWLDSIVNLIECGTYSVDLRRDTGYFYRPPGYSFFMGIFYLLANKDVDLTYHLIVWAQILMDTFSIWVIYKIVVRTLHLPRTALLASLLYAFYPFAIVWTPIAYAETASVFFMLLSIYFFLHEEKKWNFIFSGALLGIAVLTRLQIVLFFPVICVAFLFYQKKNLIPAVKKLAVFISFFLLVYGAWPVRNYVNYNRIVFSQDLSALFTWDTDYTSFMDYIYSIKTDHEPQFSEIIHGKKVEFPKSAYLVKGDSAKLVYVTQLCHTCGTGFSAWMKNEGMRKNYLPEDSSCSKEISGIFSELKQHQVRYNPLNYFLLVPLQNLKKAFFKTTLYKPASALAGYISSLFFLYRIFILFSGLIGLVLYFLNNRQIPFLLCLIAVYFVIWYLYLCFIYRNIEIRYLLQGDLLMLIPAGYLIDVLLKKSDKKKRPPQREKDF